MLGRSALLGAANSGEVDPNFSAVSLLLRNGPTDESSPTKIITAYGTAGASTSTVKYGSKSIAVNGYSSYISTSTDSSLGLGTGNFTIEFWLYMTSAWSSSTGIFGFSDGHGLSNFGGYLAFWQNNGFYYYSNITLAQNQWVHIALTRDGTSLKTYINGTLKWNAGNFSASLGASSFIDIGRHNNTYNCAVTGFIDDFRITKGIVRYTSDFTPPLAELPGS